MAFNITRGDRITGSKLESGVTNKTVYYESLLFSFGFFKIQKKKKFAYISSKCVEAL